MLKVNRNDNLLSVQHGGCVIAVIVLLLLKRCNVMQKQRGQSEDKANTRRWPRWWWADVMHDLTAPASLFFFPSGLLTPFSFLSISRSNWVSASNCFRAAMLFLCGVNFCTGTQSCVTRGAWAQIPLTGNNLNECTLEYRLVKNDTIWLEFQSNGAVSFRSRCYRGIFIFTEL